MKAKLFLVGSGGKGEEYEIGGEATIGRSRQSAIRIQSKGVSSSHARIYFDGERGRYFLEDLDSLNGTTLDGLPVSRPEPLEGLHVIEFAAAGRFVFQEIDREPGEPTLDVDAEPTLVSDVEEGDVTAPTKKPAPAGKEAAAVESMAAEEVTGPIKTAVDQEMPAVPESLADLDGEPTGPTRTAVDEETPVPAQTAVDQEMPAVPDSLAEATATSAAAPEPEPTEAAEPEVAARRVTFSLRFEGADAPAPTLLTEGERVLGRSRSADITVESRSVSRRHAILKLAGGKVTLLDLASRNHTFVNGERITEAVVVEPGSRLRFGDLDATLVADEDEE
jgi:pSer/pThr/pTyr-binding forkhead associated (FHA) protein